MRTHKRVKTTQQMKRSISIVPLNTPNELVMPTPANSVFKRFLSAEQLTESGRNTLSEALGIKITEVGPDYLRATMPVDARTKQPFGLLHGGASVALAETLGSIAGLLCVADDKITVGLEINANHVRAATSGEVTGTARPIHIGGRTQVWEIRILDNSQALICISRITLAIVPRPSP
jgi:1,4-dihydroxy-2-naphthoyl-CoA hydrolase